MFCIFEFKIKSKPNKTKNQEELTIYSATEDPGSSYPIPIYPPIWDTGHPDNESD